MSNLRVRERPSRPVQGIYVNEASVVIHRYAELGAVRVGEERLQFKQELLPGGHVAAGFQFLSISGLRQEAAGRIKMAHDQNVSGVGGGNESHARVLRRPVSAPGLRADMGSLAPVLLAR